MAHERENGMIGRKQTHRKGLAQTGAKDNLKNGMRDGVKHHAKGKAA